MRAALEGLPGVTKVVVDENSGQVELNYQGRRPSEKELSAAVQGQVVLPRLRGVLDRIFNR